MNGPVSINSMEMSSKKCPIGCDELAGLYEQGIITKKEFKNVLGKVDPNDLYAWRIIGLLDDGEVTKEEVRKAFEKTTEIHTLLKLLDRKIITSAQVMKNVGPLEERSLVELIHLHGSGIIGRKEARKRLGLK